jgi:hypothetical protein
MPLLNPLFFNDTVLTFCAISCSAVKFVFLNANVRYESRVEITLILNTVNDCSGLDWHPNLQNSKYMFRKKSNKCSANLQLYLQVFNPAH